LSLSHFISNLRAITYFNHAGINMTGSWGCPHEVKGLSSKVKNLPCDPGMKGCVLYGRFAFSSPEKNSPSIRRKLEGRKTEKGSDEK
jgi:hypothetical protein